MKTGKKYTHIFFDLDRTIWDFDRNSAEVIAELFKEFDIGQKTGADFHTFHEIYLEENHQLWELYLCHEITKDQLRSSRFNNTFGRFGFSDAKLGVQLEELYIARSPYKKQLFPDALNVLEYLNKKYSLHIITNGFREVQHTKLNSCGLTGFFGSVVISEELGINKPDPRIFRYAAENANADINTCLMIGDDYEVDILGARNSGMDAVWFNHCRVKVPEFSMFNLKDVFDFL